MTPGSAGPPNPPHKVHPLLPPIGLTALAALVFAAWIGLARLGFDLGRPPTGQHGPLMVLGFLGTVIAVERAVALRQTWAWSAPLLSAAGVICLLFGWSLLGTMALFAAGAALVAVYVAAVWAGGPHIHLLVMGLGAISWMIATAGLAVGAGVPSVVPALTGFLVLTICGERLELSRMGPPRPVWWRPAFLGLALLLVIAIGLASINLPVGSAIAGLALVGLAATSWHGDVARRTIRSSGVTRYMAAALLVGYIWLAAGGIMWLSGGLVPGTSTYDAAIHTILIGFVLSMVFAHAPVIIPAVAGVELPYRPSWWVALGLLHASLLARVIGDLLAPTARVKGWGAVGNVTAILVFVGLSAYSASTARGARRRHATIR